MSKEQNIEQRIKRVIAEQMGTYEDSVKPEKRLVEDLGADSLDEIELVMAFEDEFSIEIPDEKADEIKTVQQAIDYITSRAAEIE